MLYRHSAGRSRRGGDRYAHSGGSSSPVFVQFLFPNLTGSSSAAVRRASKLGDPDRFQTRRHTARVAAYTVGSAKKVY